MRRAWLLIVLLAATALGAIAIPNLHDATQRSRERRTMEDMRTIANAVEARAADFNNEYPIARTLNELAPLVEPKYVKKMPRMDRWGHPFRYEATKDSYGITSSGRDGRFEHASARDYQQNATTTTDYDRDIVYAMGSFVQYPDVGF
jgi:type II secretory pathway pseudopilin PulG